MKCMCNEIQYVNLHMQYTVIQNTEHLRQRTDHVIKKVILLNSVVHEIYPAH